MTTELRRFYDILIFYLCLFDCQSVIMPALLLLSHKNPLRTNLKISIKQFIKVPLLHHYFPSIYPHSTHVFTSMQSMHHTKTLQNYKYFLNWAKKHDFFIYKKIKCKTQLTIWEMRVELNMLKNLQKANKSQKNTY